jgi:hypothetical protein
MPAAAPLTLSDLILDPGASLQKRSHQVPSATKSDQ